MISLDEKHDPRFPLLRSKENALRLITIATKIGRASKQSKPSPFLWGIPRAFYRELFVDPTGHQALTSTANNNLALLQFEPGEHVPNVIPLPFEIRSEDCRSMSPFVNFVTAQSGSDLF
jgi:hypothetical protein